MSRTTLAEIANAYKNTLQIPIGSSLHIQRDNILSDSKIGCTLSGINIVSHNTYLV